MICKIKLFRREYEIYNKFKYLYIEGHFEDSNINNKNIRTDYFFKFHKNYFKDSKHPGLDDIANLICHIPYELNMKYSNFALQISDYIQVSYFRENYSFIKKTIDSSFVNDTGRKITYMVILFPSDVEVRIYNFRLTKGY